MNRIYLLLALFALSACNIEEFNDVLDVPSAESPLEIYVSVSDFTKGELVEEPIDMGSIGLYCAMTGSDEWSQSTQFTKLDNRRFDVSSDGDWVMTGASETWGYESLNDKYSFFAYSPHSDSAQGVTTSISDGELVIKYSVPDSSANQPDLMFAVPRKDIFPQVVGGVSLSFVHVLSSVSFSVVSSSGVKITSIDISGVKSEGEMLWDYTNNVPVWSPTGSNEEVFSVEVDNYTLDDDNSAMVNTKRGYMMMIPQQLTDGAKVVLKLDNGEVRNLMIPEDSEWKAGVSYRYNVNLDDVEGGYIYDSSQISNCYIINATAGEEVVIQIPIEDRINDFWYTYSGKNTTKITSSSETSEFYVMMLWEDFEGSVTYPYEVLRDSDNKMAVRLTISSEKQEGNFVFAVKVSDGNGLYTSLWSWHLWFTDYNPDAIAKANKSNILAGVDTLYTLDGYEGAVHRYADGTHAVDSMLVWSGIYKDKFIMDRNIGERSEPATDCGAGVIYYQYGRKDPLPGTGATYLSGSTTMPSKWAAGYDLFYAAEYPEHFLYSSYSPYNWCGDTEARTSNIIWYDKKISAAGYTEGKSIFDPSPLGWRIPVCDTWSSFVSAESDCDASVGVYAAYGYRNAATKGAITNAGTETYVWSANKYTDYINGMCLYIYDGVATCPKDMFFSAALPVRAIQE